MRASAVLPPGVYKEIRALCPVWALSIAALGASILWRDGFPVGIIAYFVAVLALGAQSVGQEFDYRTLPLLLSQPVDRRRLYRIKAAVLIPMALTVAAIAAVILYNTYSRESTQSLVVMVAMPLACGLFLAPWLTMSSGSSLGGAVFSFALPGILYLLSAIVPWPAARFWAWLVALMGLFAVAAVAGWRRFMRLEVIDTAGDALQLPAWLRSRSPRPHHPLWMLTVKELHLQHITFAVVALYVFGWLLFSGLRQIVPNPAEIPLDVLTPLYLAALAIVIGSVASAEERQYGTVEWQRLLPVAAWRQWMMKVAVVFGLTVLFAIALPAVHAVITEGLTRRPPSLGLEVALVIILLTAGSLYVSSLCDTGLRAAIASLAILPAALGIFVVYVRMAVQAVLSWGLEPIRVPWPWPRRMTEPIVVTILEFAFVVLLLRLAYANHRSGDRSQERALRQVAVIIGYLAVSALVLAAVSLLF